MLYANRHMGGFPDCSWTLPLILQLTRRGRGRQAPLALDVGANIGSCTMLMLAAGLRVAAFEPTEDNLAHLIETARRNPAIAGVGRLLVLPFGLASRERQLPIFSQAGNLGNSMFKDFEATRNESKAQRARALALRPLHPSSRFPIGRRHTGRGPPSAPTTFPR
jgi:FkbM family methyltransferase